MKLIPQLHCLFRSQNWFDRQCSSRIERGGENVDSLLRLVKKIENIKNIKYLNQKLNNDWYIINYNRNSGVYTIGYAPEFRKRIKN